MPESPSKPPSKDELQPLCAYCGNGGRLDSHLFAAVRRDDVVEAQRLIKTGKTDVNIEETVTLPQSGVVSYTPLRLAAEKGLVDMVKMLLQTPNIEINARDQQGLTALHRASMEGNVEIVEAILQVNDDAINQEELTNSRLSPIHLAAAYGRVEVVKALMNYPSFCINKVNSYGRTALHYASEADEAYTVDALLQSKEICVNVKDYIDLHTPLHCAVYGRHPDIVEILLDHADTDVNAKDRYGQTALFRAAFNGDALIVRMLLGAGVDANVVTAEGKNALYCATRNGAVFNMIKEYLQNPSCISSTTVEGINEVDDASQSELVDVPDSDPSSGDVNPDCEMNCHPYTII